ncbi:class GN sortase [Pelagibius marinus]|uniref:class GN sortase n=1 Tax=Pelagibius marinus TaxID=2762760 RepID=UPI0029CA6572|nr:class GN sortase [Pelagibius marinus]
MVRAFTLNRFLLGLALLSLALGLWQLGGAAAIHAKAWLAQRLLDRAWAATLAGEAEAKPWPWADTWPVARLQVPELDVDLYVLAGASGRTLAFGPAVVPGTEILGHRILSGHRDTHFAFLRELAAGSRLRLQDDQGRWRDFTVRAHEVIDVRHPVFARHAAALPLVSLVTCYPFDAVMPGGPLRYVVTAEAVAATAEDTAPRGEAALIINQFGGTKDGEGIPDGSL